MGRSATNIIGVCGEHYVSAYLSGWGLIVALPRGGNPGTDLFVASASGGPGIRIQVKTGTDSYHSIKKEAEPHYRWPTTYSVIDQSDKSLWFAYVWLRHWPKGEEQPEVFFVPAAFVAERMRTVREEKRDKPNAWTFFWMWRSEAEKYKGRQGLGILLDTINSEAQNA